MKIVGTAADGKFLIEASSREIANLFGFYWEGELRERKIELKPGMEIQPSLEYEGLAWLRSRSSEFTKLTDQLRKTADMIEAKKGAFDTIIGDSQ